MDAGWERFRIEGNMFLGGFEVNKRERVCMREAGHMMIRWVVQ